MRSGIRRAKPPYRPVLDGSGYTLLRREMTRSRLRPPRRGRGNSQRSRIPISLPAGSARHETGPPAAIGGRGLRFPGRQLRPASDDVQSRISVNSAMDDPCMARRQRALRGYALSANITLVVGGAQQLVQFVRGRQSDSNKPGLAVRILIELLGRGLERFVDFDHLAGNRRIDIRHRFHGFYRAQRLPLFEFRADFRQVDIYDVAQLLLSVVRDSDPSGIAVHAHPLVFFGVTVIFWISAHFDRL